MAGVRGSLPDPLIPSPRRARGPRDVAPDQRDEDEGRHDGDRRSPVLSRLHETSGLRASAAITTDTGRLRRFAGEDHART